MSSRTWSRRVLSVHRDMLYILFYAHGRRCDYATAIDGSECHLFRVFSHNAFYDNRDSNLANETARLSFTFVCVCCRWGTAMEINDTTKICFTFPAVLRLLFLFSIFNYWSNRHNKLRQTDKTLTATKCVSVVSSTFQSQLHNLIFFGRRNRDADSK